MLHFALTNLASIVGHHKLSNAPSMSTNMTYFLSHEPSRTVVIVDVTVPFENTFVALEKVMVEKVRKYQPLANALRGRGYDFVVGAPGAWHLNNVGLANFLRVSSRYASLMRLLMVLEMIAWSQDMYVEHVSGIRQYRVLETAGCPGEHARDRVRGLRES